MLPLSDQRWSLFPSLNYTLYCRHVVIVYYAIRQPHQTHNNAIYSTKHKSTHTHNKTHRPNTVLKYRSTEYFKYMTVDVRP